MYFSNFLLLLAAVVAASLTSAYVVAVEAVIEKRDPTASDAVNYVNTLKNMTEKLQDAANKIDAFSNDLYLIHKGPFHTLIKGFERINSTGIADFNAMQDLPTITVTDDEQSILEAVTKFVTVNQKLLKTMIDKANFANKSTGPPIAKAILDVEAVYDQIEFKLIDVCPDVASSLTDLKDSLDQDLNDAIKAYSPEKAG